MSARVTQCPQCNTSFRVTDAQLQAANGSVRCGSCLCIFDATQHWLDAPRKSQPPPAPKPSPAPSPPRQPAPSARSAAPASPSRTEAPPPKPSAPEAAASAPPPSPPAEKTTPERTAGPESTTGPERTAEPDKPPPAADIDIDDDDLLFDDDSPIFGDEEDEPETPPSKRPVITSADEYDEEDYASNQGDTFLDIDDWEEEPQSIFKELDELGDEAYDSGDESWAKQLLAEIEEEDTDESDEPDKPQPETNIESDDVSDDVIDDLLADVPEPAEEQDDFDDLLLAADAYEHAEQDGEKLTDEFVFGELSEEDQASMRDTSAHLLKDLEPEPLQFNGHPSYRDWRGKAVAGALVAACLLFAFQYVYFNFDRLARGEQRELWASVCGLVGCELPPLTNLKAIRSSNLIVRSHPDIKGALVVDAIMTNVAKFEQPYPLLELRFSDMAGNIVAHRRFQPDEYLGGELSGSRSMPSRQPIHVSLEIVDPGQDAVNYEINFAPARSG